VKNRSRNDIVSEILKIANYESGTSKTRIMYGAYLSHAQLKDYLKMLADNDLLFYDTKSMRYKTTEVGRNFLKLYERIDGIFESKQVTRSN